MATLTAPFTAAQLKAAIGASGNNADAYFTGSDGTINPYSPIKPVRHSQVGTSGASLMQSCNYGFNTSVISFSISTANLNTLFTYAKTTYKTWDNTYQLPTSSYKYRWDDFNGYNDAAVAPFDYSGIQKSITALTIEQEIARNTPAIDVTKMGAVTDYSGWEWAIVHRKQGSTSVTYSYGGAISSSGDITITQTFASTGTYECVFVITNGSRIIWMSGGYFEVTVKSATASISPAVDSAMWNSTRTSISFTALATNNGVSNVTISSAVARLRFLEKDFDSAMVSGEYEFSLGFTSIGAGATVRKTITQTIPAAYRERDYIVYVKIIVAGTEYDAFEEVLADEVELG